jgi:hypothetical protein
MSRIQDMDLQTARAMARARRMLRKQGMNASTGIQSWF